jgi:hypothetical protein
VFAALIAIDVSLVGWLAHIYANARWALILAGAAASVAATYGVARVNQVVYARVHELEDA